MMQPSKQSFKDHFSEVSAAYSAHRPGYPPALIEFLAGAASRRDFAWDSGCGSGQLSVPLTGSFERVIATDASPDQLAEAAPHSKVEYRCAPAEDCGLPDSAVDLAVTAQAAHWFDLPGYYAEVRRVTRPGSVVALVSYGCSIISDEIDSVISDFYSRIVGPYWPPERRHVEAGYRSLPFPFDEVAAPKLEMSASWSLADMAGYVETWSAAHALQKAEGRAPVERFRCALASAWGREDSVRLVRWPLSLRVGRL